MIHPRQSDYAYVAGLFDGEGSVYFKKTTQKKHQRRGQPVHNVTIIRMEIAMTDKSTLEWCYHLFKRGSFSERKVKNGYKRQWRWRTTHRDALHCAKRIYPYSKTKAHHLLKVIHHYRQRGHA